MQESAYRKPDKAYALWRTDDTLRRQSSSGGLAAVLSERMIAEGGIVYGCAFEKPFSVKHVRCSSANDLEKLKRSKYVQSDLTGIHSQLMNDLKSGKKVLFIGTPCQVATVALYAQKFAANLFTVDVICHGVPSMQLFKSSLPAGIIACSIDKLTFRDDTAYILKMYKSGKIIYKRELHTDLYMKGFFKAVFCRDSCHECKYAKNERVSDLTIGDFWGVDKSQIHTNTDYGLSLALVNSEKGRIMLRDIASEVNMVERPVEEAIAGNKQLKFPMKKTWRTKIFKLLYPICGFKCSAVCSMPDIVLKNLIIRK
ncbi:coenzyme F420-reducing hydrogenase, beta subunit [Prevotella sp. PINT]|jgi:Coenzyme F420-reducing hydrogenase, beta subunit|uniref:Coenzyme F420 hydrogenase/dehydrogenase, beta subunit C-terminal domain n=1 Tax=Palleniella intestinalis TaxID=2736291 RepID=UPI0015536545|nr:Coenzyme F420 hydrogenase/dehydrogenase, beta subunit C-terminal domain [Palleniella intestinalis]NPD82806.1 coenzyme F420-reducing hydrogenase, beta subunit [Palleniella intestinalis]